MHYEKIANNLKQYIKYMENELEETSSVLEKKSKRLIRYREQNKKLNKEMQQKNEVIKTYKLVNKIACHQTL